MHAMTVLMIVGMVEMSSQSAIIRSLLGRTGVIPGQEKPVKFADTQPRIELRVSPPHHPLPELSGKIEVLDFARKKLEERLTAKLLKSYDEEIKRARTLITALIREALSNFDDPAVLPKSRGSFFELPSDTWQPGRIWVSVDVPQPVDGAVIKRVETMEVKNGRLESTRAEAVIEDMHEVTRMFLQQLNETLVNAIQPVIATHGIHAYSSLIDLRCEELSVQLGQSDICHKHIRTNHTITALAEEHMYPTVESLVQQMLDRREIDQNLFRARAVALMAKLAAEESRIAGELLQAASAAIVREYAPVIENINMTKAELQEYRRTHVVVDKHKLVL